MRSVRVTIAPIPVLGSRIGVVEVKAGLLGLIHEVYLASSLLNWWRIAEIALGLVKVGGHAWVAIYLGLLKGFLLLLHDLELNLLKLHSCLRQSQPSSLSFSYDLRRNQVTVFLNNSVSDDVHVL